MEAIILAIIELANTNPWAAATVVCLWLGSLLIINLTPTPQKGALRKVYRAIELMAGIINSRKVKQ